jgi:hypothetical protein
MSAPVVDNRTRGLPWHSINEVRRPANMVASFLSFPKNQGEKSMTEERHCIFCWDSDEPETLQPLFPGPGALSDVEPAAWVHKSCLEEYSSPTGDDVEEIAALGKMTDVDDDDPEDGSEVMAKDEISRLRERSELLDLLADAVDMLNIAMMEIHAWHASGSPTEEERQRLTEIEATRNRIRHALRGGTRGNDRHR